MWQEHVSCGTFRSMIGYNWTLPFPAGSQL